MDRWLGTALTAADGRRREIRVVDARPVAAGPILGSRGVSAVRRCRVVLRALSSSRSRIKIEQEYSKAGSPDGRYCCKKIFRVRAALPQPRDADDEQRRRDEALRRELFLYGKVTLPAKR